MAKKDLLKEIKDMEDKSRQVAGQQSMAASQGNPQKVDLDSWYFLRSKQIPNHHMKEIVRADFRARGLSEQETMEAFDKALESYGVKLK